MGTIQLYSDESKSQDESFCIYSMIYGTPENIDLLNQELKKIIHPIECGDKNYKGLHSYNLNEKNWRKTGKKYEGSLDILFDFIKQNKIEAKISVLGIERYNKTIGFLKTSLKNELEKEDSIFHKTFKSFTTKDYPALYHRMDSLYVYFLYRDKIAPSGTLFELYPDSSGKVLQYNDKQFNVQGKTYNRDLNFNNILNVIANTLTESMNQLAMAGWSKNNHTVTDFRPLKSDESYIIQICDVLANFFFCYLRYNIGIQEEKYRLKSDALTSRVIGLSGNILNNFIIYQNDISLKDKDLAWTLNLDNKVNVP